MTATRWMLILAGLIVAAALGLLLFPFSSDSGACGSAAFPRYNRDSPHANERWCADSAYEGRREAAAVLLLVSVASAVAMAAKRSARGG